MILALLLHLFAAQVAPRTFSFPIPIPPGCTAAVIGSNIMITCPIPAVTPPPPPPPALKITTPISLPGALVGKVYSVNLAQLAIPTGGMPPYKFAAISGFPSWLKLSSAGILAGTPTTSGNFTLSFSVTDSSGATQTILGNGESVEPLSGGVMTAPAD